MSLLRILFYKVVRPFSWDILVNEIFKTPFGRQHPSPDSGSGKLTTFWTLSRLSLGKIGDKTHKRPLSFKKSAVFGTIASFLNIL